MAARKRRSNETYSQYKSHLRLEQKATNFLLEGRKPYWLNDYWKVIHKKRVNFLNKRLFVNWS